jgi:hypothetical protein
MPLFEVQKFSDGEWRPYSAFDEKILAIDAAKDLMRRDRAPSGVRVMEEPDDDSAPRMIFRQTAVDDHNDEVAKRRRETREEAHAARRVREAKKQDIREAKKARKGQAATADAPGMGSLALRSAVLLTVAVGTLWLLRIYVYR